MRLGGRRTSSNIERGGGGGGGFSFGGGGGFPMGGGGGLGCGGIILVIIIAVVFGVNPLQLLGGGEVLAPSGTSTTAPSATGDAALRDETDRFVSQVLASTEDRWAEIFKAQGETYTPATLVFYDRSGRSGCGLADAAMGPFYCPADGRIYLDTTFFDELRQRFGAPGDFAQAYVIAHEVGHHIQALTGTAEQVRRLQARASEAEGNALQVKMELQADCYAGVWANREKAILEPGDIEEGMRAAGAIGDDTLQQAAGRRPVPESFTHGTSAERMSWLKRGLDTGDPARCDTFA
jgi:predicted metalloprotease